MLRNDIIELSHSKRLPLIYLLRYFADYVEHPEQYPSRPICNQEHKSRAQVLEKLRRLKPVLVDEIVERLAVLTDWGLPVEEWGQPAVSEQDVQIEQVEDDTLKELDDTRHSHWDHSVYCEETQVFQPCP
jgi:hypothetical protein